ncbi:MAG: protein kinase [Clostridia bacterium]|nr:protein kinase [Clostridia bacterium]
MLCYLHTQTPPVIHRDIKPQNIIVKPDGSIALIDFDIARQYSEKAETDTQFFGTRVYAPPEQYGFSQTDCRTDVYSLGVLLRFLLTGAEKPREETPVPAQYRRIVDRCTAFSPKDRYATVANVKRALLQADGKRKKRLLASASLLLFALAFLCAGFAIGRYTTLFTPKAAVDAVTFTEPLIEAAARVQLGKTEGEPLTAEELLTVKELYIFGTEVSATLDAFDGGLGSGKEYIRGDISSLADLSLMPNIEKLQIAYQTLEDASGLSALNNPVCVNLMHTQVSDLSALSGRQTLEQLNLYDTCVTDLSCLETCGRLVVLEVGDSTVSSTDLLGGYDTVKVLSLKRLNLKSLDGIEKFTRLEILYLNDAVIGNADALTGLPQLKEVYVSGVSAEMITQLLSGTDVSVIAE